MKTTKTYEELAAELQELRDQLEEANDTIDAIRSGAVDALVVKGQEGTPQLYTLKNVDQTYRIFIEQMNEGAVTLSENNIILYTNSQFASLAKLPPEKVTGQSFISFITPECKVQCSRLIENAWAENKKDEMLLLASDGSSVPVLMSFKTLHLDEGLSMSIIITDLTFQKHTQQLLTTKNEQLEEAQSIAQQLNISLEQKVKDRTFELEISVQEKTLLSDELRSNQERLTLILETMAEGVGIVDTNGNLTYANPMAQKILGLKQSEILTRTYDDPKWANLRVDGSPLPEGEHPMAIMLQTGKPVYDYEIGVQPPGADLFYISINAAPIFGNGGQLIGGVGTFMDVTNRRKTTQQKDEFISVASHELKTPLTTLKASLQLLSGMMITEKESPLIPVFLGKANNSIVRLSSLVDDLLNVSRLEKGQIVLNLSTFMMYEMVKENIEGLQLADKMGRAITISGDESITLTADKFRIEQVFTNLMNNAIKYSPAGAPIAIAIETYGQNQVKVSVQDFGIGIPAEKVEHLFDRYFRVDYSGTQYTGLGLGLYISSEIIHRHNGQMGVDSEMGKGSTFWFVIPCSPA